jgi:hypothetical protein
MTMRTTLLMLITALMLASTSTSFAGPFGTRIRSGEGIVPPPKRATEPLWQSTHTPKLTFAEFVQPPPKTFAETLGARDLRVAVQ